MTSYNAYMADIMRGLGYEDIWVLYNITDPYERHKIKRQVLYAGYSRSDAQQSKTRRIVAAND